MGLRINAAVYSHIGGRKNNEDNFYFNGLYMEREQMDRGGQFQKEYADASQMYAVCDGMGGAEFGEEASLFATRSLKKYQSGSDSLDSPEQLRDVLGRMSAGIDQISFSHGMPSGASGSTIAMLIFQDWYFRAVHVGDSRIYRLRNNRIERMTKDHSEVQRMIDCGQITPDQAWQHPLKNVITRHLGMPLEGMPLDPTISQPMELQPGDRFLICSDGLNDVVHDTVIERMLGDGKAPIDTAAALVRQALIEADGFQIPSDNVTVIVLDVVKVGKRANVEKKIRKLNTLRGLYMACAAAFAAGFAYMGYDVIQFLLR